MKMRIAGIIKESVVDGPGIRYVVFSQGCFHECPGCHNQNTHDPMGGYEVNTEDIAEDIKTSHLISGVTLSGGEPFLQAEANSILAGWIKSIGLNVVTYTGYTFEELKKNSDINIEKLLMLTDILIDGKFQLKDRDLSLKFRGSKNQRVIDVKKSLDTNSVVLMYD